MLAMPILVALVGFLRTDSGWVQLAAGPIAFLAFIARLFAHNQQFAEPAAIRGLVFL